MMRKAMPCLVIQLPNGIERSHDLPEDGEFRARIGRDEHCEICLPAQSVSGEHALIQRKDGAYVIEDAGSTNGLKINGLTPSGVAVLRDGDSIRIGDVHLIYKVKPVAGRKSDDDAAPAPVTADGPAAPAGVSAELQRMADSAQRRSLLGSLWMVMYALLMFALAVVAGMTYKHYKQTGEFLPLKWMGQTTPKEALKDK